MIDVDGTRARSSEPEVGDMQTSLRIDGANCPTCFNETLDALAHLDGVRAVHGSFAGPCIEIDHDAALVSPRDCIDDCSYVGCRGSAAQRICARAVVEATGDPG